MNRDMDAWPEISHREEARVVKFIAEVQGHSQQGYNGMRSIQEVPYLIRP
jgi:hypothetical protein